MQIRRAENALFIRNFQAQKGVVSRIFISIDAVTRHKDKDIVFFAAEMGRNLSFGHAKDARRRPLGAGTDERAVDIYFKCIRPGHAENRAPASGTARKSVPRHVIVTRLSVRADRNPPSEITVPYHLNMAEIFFAPAESMESSLPTEKYSMPQDTPFWI